jgi:hypothetical protein
MNLAAGGDWGGRGVGNDYSAFASGVQMNVRHVRVLAADDQQDQQGGKTANQYPCSQWGWRFHDGFDIVSHDIGSLPKSDRNDCQNLCRARGECRGYSWAGGVCYFKSGGYENNALVGNSQVYSATIC